jgi:hypothetical protein
MTPNLSQAVWYKSSRSGGNGGNCVEVANLDDSVAVRDSKNPDNGVLVFAKADWTVFVSAVQSGDYDL